MTVDKYTRHIFSTSALLLIFLILRAVSVTQESSRSNSFRLSEAWALLASLDLSDYLTVIVGTVVSNLTLAAFTFLVVGWLVMKYESPMFFADSQWQLSVRSAAIMAPILLAWLYLISRATWPWKVGVIVLLVAAIQDLRFTSLLPHTADAGARRAYRRLVRVPLGDLSMTFELESSLRRERRAARHALHEWNKLRRLLRNLSSKEVESQPDDADRVEAHINRCLVADGEYLVLHRNNRSVLKQKWTKRKSTLIAVTASFPSIFHGLLRATMTAAVFVAIGCVLTMTGSRKPWVPVECLVTNGSTAPITGYRLADSGSVITVLVKSNRQVEAVPAYTVQRIEENGCAQIAAVKPSPK